MDNNDSLKNIFQKATEMKIEPKKTAWDRLELNMQKEKFKKQTHWATMSIAASFVIFMILSLFYLVKFMKNNETPLAHEKTIEVHGQNTAEAVYGKVPQEYAKNTITVKNTEEEPKIVEIPKPILPKVEYTVPKIEHSELQIDPKKNDYDDVENTDDKSLWVAGNFSSKDTVLSAVAYHTPQVHQEEIYRNAQSVIMNQFYNTAGYIETEKMKKNEKTIAEVETAHTTENKNFAVTTTTSTSEEKPKGLILIRKKLKNTSTVN